MDDFSEQLYELIGRGMRGRSKAAAGVGTGCQMLVGHNPNRDKSPTTAGSKAASVIVEGNMSKKFMIL